MVSTAERINHLKYEVDPGEELYELLKSLGPIIVVIGGGTGSYTVLSGLKEDAKDGTVGIPSMADNDGSGGVLKYRFGTLPAGDPRQHLIALSNNELMRRFFDYRWNEDTRLGDTDHSQGNLFLQMIQNAGGNFEEAIAEASRVLEITGQVIPATLDKSELVVTPFGSGPIVGEHTIGKTKFTARGAIIGFDQSPTNLNPRAAQAIRWADLIIFAPGSPVTSVGAALAVDGMSASIIEAQERGTKVVSIANLTQDIHTQGYDVRDLSEAQEQIIGSGFKVDYIVYNTKPPRPEEIKAYEDQGHILVPLNEKRLRSLKTIKAIGAPLLANGVSHGVQVPEHKKNDALIRHDSYVLSKVIMSIHYREAYERYRRLAGISQRF